MYVAARAELQSLGQGSTFSELGRDDLEQFRVLLPPPDEQRAIASFLDRETAKIDALIAKKEQLIAVLEEKRSALISHVVTKGLEEGVEMKVSPVPAVGEVPAHWKDLRVAYLFRERDERGFPDLPLLNVSINTGTTIREFADDRIEQRAEDPGSYKRARVGDLVFNKMRMWQGAVGVAPVDGLVSPDYTVAVPMDGADATYFELLFRTPWYLTEIDRHSHGIVKDRNRLYWDGFRAIRVAVPPRDEQAAIVVRAAETAAEVHSLSRSVHRGIELFREYRSSLITAAVTGKIDVRGVPV